MCPNFGQTNLFSCSIRNVKVEEGAKETEQSSKSGKKGYHWLTSTVGVNFERFELTVPFLDKLSSEYFISILYYAYCVRKFEFKFQINPKEYILQNFIMQKTSRVADENGLVLSEIHKYINVHCVYITALIRDRAFYRISLLNTYIRFHTCNLFKNISMNEETDSKHSEKP